VGPGIAYLHIASFEGKTPDEVATALDGMDAPHLKGLFLDLRDNHGGIVDSAAAVASLFLKQGEVVLTTRRPQDAGKGLSRTSHAPALRSAHRRVGQWRHGQRCGSPGCRASGTRPGGHCRPADLRKGVVQTVEELSEDTGLAVTAGQYFTPSGRSIQRPLPGTALTFASLSPSADPQGKSAGTGNDPAGRSAASFHTDNGRPVTMGGGVTPMWPLRRPRMTRGSPSSPSAATRPAMPDPI